MRIPAAAIASKTGLDHLALPFDRASIRPMPPGLQKMLGSRITAITLNTVVFVDPERYARMVEGEDATLFAHELIHVAQWQAEGIPTFLFRYATDYLRLRSLGLDHHTAYRHIGYEWDAYEQSAKLT